MIAISYNLGGFGEINCINDEPQGLDIWQEHGHYFLQKQTDGSLEWIGGFGRTNERPASYLYLAQGTAPDWADSGYLWLDSNYLWLGTKGNKAVTFGCLDLEQLRLFPNNGLFLGDGEEIEDAIGAYEIGTNKATDAPTAPGPGRAKFAFIADPANPGKAALVAYAGTSAEPTIIVSGIGDGF